MYDGSQPIDNSADILDSRDIIARIEYLEALADEAADAQGDTNGITDEERDELIALRELADEASGYAPDWNYGETLIRDTYFVTYAQELAEDIGAIRPDLGWPYSCIDWEKAAWELRMDYSSVEFDGVTYWIR